ncbi:hypothetical protein [Streptomyces anandii]|uniref:hypothetical protein n=1 Tax=Streptomyces anandii TaxID=285454 RepID=UPI0016725462|nr:hypothetical protein [Streptomyces anandii]
MEPVDELSLLNLSPFASSEQYRHRTAVSLRSAAQALVLRKQINDEVPALLESHPGTGLRRLFEFLLITTDLVTLSLDSCAGSLNGPRLMGSAPRLTRVGMTIARARVIVTLVSDLLNEISDDYGGADMRDVDLDDVDLSWLRWDEETQWPPTWATRIRRMSIEMSPGHWVVQPIDTTEDVELLV